MLRLLQFICNAKKPCNKLEKAIPTVEAAVICHQEEKDTRTHTNNETNIKQRKQTQTNNETNIKHHISWLLLASQYKGYCIDSTEYVQRNNHFCLLMPIYI